MPTTTTSTIKKPPHLNLSSTLKSLMKNSALSEAELARKTHIPQATINRILLGGTIDPRASTLRALARIFEISVDELLGEPSSGISQEVLENVTYIPILTWSL